jgi:hypothetical protein
MRHTIASSGYRVKYNGVFVDEMTDAQFAAYVRSRQADADRLKEMFETGQTPCIQTEDTRFSGFTKVGGAQFGDNDQLRNFYLGEAKKAGVDVTGKQYFSQLADRPGDPRAWVDSTGDMRRLIEERGWSSDGDVKVKAERRAPRPDCPLAPDIAEDLIEEKLEAVHGPDFETIPRKDYEHAKEDVLNTHAAPKHLTLNAGD